MITLGSPCKMHEVLVRVGVTRIAKQEVLPRVGMTRIGKQWVMARVGRTWIVMHGRLPRGKSALDRELAIVLVGLGVWLDIESDRAGYTGCKDFGQPKAVTLAPGSVGRVCHTGPEGWSGHVAHGLHTWPSKLGRWPRLFLSRSALVLRLYPGLRTLILNLCSDYES
ncbi:hypothetical protein LWI29_036255 [Acer saccharum]|uniref:Uncharacterized protein n=1 Tax=Acer saccharum TaxID=4024 RepID=A0AA39W7Q6_ACESA|nr:hypothetical protein LWI29_036255 [Acer saccharum]